MNEGTERVGKQQEGGWKDIRRDMEELHKRVAGQRAE